MEKRISGSGKMLIGKDREGVLVWMPKASWDCGWYWGFGYLQSASSHSHFSGIFDNHGGKYVHHINESPEFSETVLTEAEAWQLSDLMKSFYTLRDAARIYARGHSNYSAKVSLNLEDESAAKRINEIDLPRIFEAIYNLLTPEAKKTSSEKCEVKSGFEAVFAWVWCF